MIKALFYLLLVSATVRVEAQPACDFIFNSSTADGAVSAIEKSRRILSEQIEFPNVVETRVVPAQSEWWSEKAQSSLTPAHLAYLAAIERAGHANTVATPSQLLPMALHYRGGFDYIRTLDWSLLVGHTVAGFQFGKHEYIDAKPKGGWANVKLDRLYFHGVVTTARTVGGKLTVTLKSPSGHEIRLDYDIAFKPQLTGNFLILAPKMSLAELLRRAFEQASFESVIGDAFGLPTTKEDYDVAAAIVDTALKVPQTWGRTAVVKIMLGRSIRGGESYAQFGLARGKKRYSEKQLQQFVGALYEFMEATGVTITSAREVKNDSPDWLGDISKTSLASEFKKMWDSLRDGKGGAETVVIAKKSRKFGDVKLSRDVAVPGTKIVVKSGTEGLLVSDEYGPGTRFIAAPGKILEIVKAPRTVRLHGSGFSLVRLRDPENGAEGETFWSWAIQFAQLTGD